MIVDIVDKYCTNDNNPIKNLRLNETRKKPHQNNLSKYIYTRLLYAMSDL